MRGQDSLHTGLLILRLGAGLSLGMLFGAEKVRDALLYWTTGHWSFIDFNRRMGVPAPVLTAYLETLNESLGAFLISIGLVTRYAAVCVAAGFVAAVYYSRRAGEGAWLIAALYAVMFGTLAFTGGGRWSVDGWLQCRGESRRAGASQTDTDV
jgi:putative oxidoreductase